MTFKGTENFKVSELEYSDTARAYKIDNTIPHITPIKYASPSIFRFSFLFLFE